MNKENMAEECYQLNSLFGFFHINVDADFSGSKPSISLLGDVMVSCLKNTF